MFQNKEWSMPLNITHETLLDAQFDVFEQIEEMAEDSLGIEAGGVRVRSLHVRPSDIEGVIVLEVRGDLQPTSRSISARKHLTRG